MGSPPVIPTPSIVEEMRQKHPHGDCDQPRMGLRTIHAAAAPEVDVEGIFRAIQSFPRYSGGGPSGLRPNHIREALVPGSRDQILDAMVGVVNCLLRGEAPESVRADFVGASLVALPKDESSHRPIAGGETLRRLTGKVAMDLVGKDASELLCPHQVGVGISGGAEALIHTCRSWQAKNKGDATKVLVQVDIRNAFNCLFRTHIREKTRSRLPALTPWVDYCYAVDSRLHFGPHVLESRRGVQQGDPLGPLLFSIGIQDFIEEPRQHTDNLFPVDLDFASFYLDDGVVAGSCEAVQTMLSHLQTSFSSVGLEFNVDKTKASPPPECPDAQPLLPWSWQQDGNIVVLGTPIGSDSFIMANLSERTKQASNLLHHIRDIDCPQTALSLARLCGSAAKMQYSMRTIPSDKCLESLQLFDGYVRAGVENILAQPLENDEWGRAARGVRFGGLGFRPTAAHAPGAYWSSLCDCQDLMVKIWPAIHVNDDIVSAEGTLESWCSREIRERVSEEGKRRQKAMSEALDRKLVDDECAADTTASHIRAHLKLVDQDGCGQWLVAPPCSEAGTLLDGELFRIAAKRRIR